MEMGLLGYHNVVKNYIWGIVTNMTNKIYDEILMNKV